MKYLHFYSHDNNNINTYPMKKHNNVRHFIFALITIIASGLCSCERIGTDNPAQAAMIKVNVSDFEIIQEQITSGKASAAETVRGISFAVFDDHGTLKYHTTQKENDLNFGTIEFPLFQGSYTLVAIGHRLSSDTATISSPYLVTFNNNVTDIFYKTQAIEVTNTTAQNISMTLDRATAAVQINSTDIIPTSAKTITYYYHEGGTTLNPSTGLCGSNTGYSSSFTIPQENYGQTAQMCRMILLNADPQAMDLTVTIKGENDVVLATHNFFALALKPGYKTIITGPVFSSSSTGTFTFNSEWLGTNTFNYDGNGLTRAK